MLGFGTFLLMWLMATTQGSSLDPQFFWWVDPLRQSLQKRRAIEEKPTRPSNLRPLEIHVKNNFLSERELHEMRLLMLRLQNQKDTSKGKGRGNRVHEGLINGAKGLIAYPGVFALHSSKRERNTLISILAKATHYLSENLILDGTLHGKHKFDKNIGIHLGVFALYEYVPDTSSVSAHTDTDYNGRCLSVALHLPNWIDDVEKNLPVEGGVFQTLRCVNNDVDAILRGDADVLDCTGVSGEKMAQMIDDGVFENANISMKPFRESSYTPGKLNAFLSESPHTVTALDGPGTRAILFMWFQCEPLNEPPEEYAIVRKAQKSAKQYRSGRYSRGKWRYLNSTLRSTDRAKIRNKIRERGYSRHDEERYSHRASVSIEISQTREPGVMVTEGGIREEEIGGGEAWGEGTQGRLEYF